MTLKELKEYPALKRQLEYLEEKIIQTKKDILNVKSPHGESVTGGIRKGMVDALAKLEGVLFEYDREYNQTIERCRKIEEAVRKVDDTDDRNILRYRYIKGCPWGETGQRANYSAKQATRRHDEMFVLQTAQDVRECPSNL